MNNYFRDIKFYDTYYFAQTVKNLLEYRFKYLRELEAFYCDDNYLEYTYPFLKISALHSFIMFIADTVIHDENCEVDLALRQRDASNFKEPNFGWYPKLLPINNALNLYSLDHDSFETWLVESAGTTFAESNPDHIYDYLEDLRLGGVYEKLLEKIAHDTFFVIFQNRKLLLLFNEMMADQINSNSKDDMPEEYKFLFSKSGVLKRSYVPQWVQDAVFFRDRGKCTFCQMDLSGSLSISNRKQFDHIVPLAKGGLNDVTNIQLLSSQCNQKKLHHTVETSEYYELWYPFE